jgi:hypothetical protein
MLSHRKSKIRRQSIVVSRSSTTTGNQDVFIKYTVRLALVGIEALVGSVGASLENASAETLTGTLQGQGHAFAMPVAFP